MRTCAPLIVLLASFTALGADKSPLPPLTGEYAVGRILFHWTDESRPDPDRPDLHRDIIVWAWYPAAPASDEAAEWMPGKWGEVFWSEYSKSRADLAGKESPIRSILSHAHANAPAESSRRYPVLLFAGGIGTTPLDYASVIEDVASHGYIVLGVISAEFGRARIFSDGQVFHGHDPVELASRPGERRTAELALRAFEEAARLYSRDLSFALTQLANGAAGPLQGRADLGRAGVFGHSLGGATALQFAHDDARVRAVFDIDGSPIWSRDNGPLHKPVLVLSASSTNVNYDALLSGAAPGRHLRLAGTAHPFSKDFGVMPFMAQGTVSRPEWTQPARALRLTATFVEAFFNQHLNGKRERLLDGPSAEYPEITFENVP
jgi:dienelactone hydrolase